MIAIVAIAVAAGAASALMFASVLSGAPISLVLRGFAPLPLMVAAIGWGPLTAAIGGIVATAAFALLFGFPSAFEFAIGTALPAWWLGHLAMLGRPVPPPAGNGAMAPAVAMEWYPTGRLLLWIAGIGALLGLWNLFKIDTDPEAIAAAMKREFAEAARLLAQRDYPIDESLVDTMSALAPVFFPTLPMIVLTVNLWLTGKI